MAAELGPRLQQRIVEQHRNSFHARRGNVAHVGETEEECQLLSRVVGDEVGAEILNSHGMLEDGRMGPLRGVVEVYQVRIQILDSVSDDALDIDRKSTRLNSS